MGEAKRRKAAGMYPTLATHSVDYPDDVKQDIAKVVRAFTYHGLPEGGGYCFFHALAGMKALSALGIPVDLAIGGMVARVGPDPRRDVVAFCGEGNVGRRHPLALLAHHWLQTGDDLVDFSVGDWQGIKNIDDLEPGQWTISLPDYHWAPRNLFLPLPGRPLSDQPTPALLTPKLGEVWYTAFAGTPLSWRDLAAAHQSEIAQIEAGLPERLEFFALKERVWAAQNGHTAIRASELARIAADDGTAVIFPKDLEKLALLRGRAEITPQEARELLSKAGIRLE